ncbi:hypothetical protein EWH70_23760 [Amycolatopsis suaedae]|uniref:Uncharacterized protein n=2 Tax=Amycolatopsis suaedae TaxID=2510978 RepID=A0A4Q7J2A0_9PSEU|nr:hypothetical protein EWH70_23760 [Amycolatopsis suaedae]
MLVSSLTPAVMAEEVSADRALVRWLARKDPRSTVRTDAVVALVSPLGEPAVSEFLATGYDYAVRRAADAKVRNLDFAKRVLATHRPEFSPAVFEASRRAVQGTDADREAFVRTGYAAAQNSDRSAREAAGEHARAIAETDRAFVRALAVNDPGAQVRGAAVWATRPGAGDGDLVEFYVHGWVSGGRLDLDSHRARAADNDMAWRATARRLVAEATEAEQAAREAAGEAAEQARQAAARAWRTVADQTTPARTAWGEAERVALAQAENWRLVAAAAAGATSPNWQAIAGSAAGNESEWMAEQTTAAEQAAYWKALYEQALAGEKEMTR